MATDTNSATPSAPHPTPPSASPEPTALTYEHIARNVASVSTEGAQVRVLWKDARTATLAGESVATMTADASMGGRMRATMQRSIVQEIAASIMRAISGVLGGGAAGRVVRDVAYSASYDLQSRAVAGAEFTEDSRRDAVLRAFADVRANFVWDAQANAFVVRQGASQ